MTAAPQSSSSGSDEAKASLLKRITRAQDATGIAFTYYEFQTLLAALSPQTEAKIVTEDDGSGDPLPAGWKPPGSGGVAQGPSDPTNHHNALLCPYCNPKGLKWEQQEYEMVRGVDLAHPERLNALSDAADYVGKVGGAACDHIVRGILCLGPQASSVSSTQSKTGED